MIDNHDFCDSCSLIDVLFHDDESGLSLCERCLSPKPKQVHRSHAACDHPKTPAARAKCRKARAKLDADAPADAAPVDVPADPYQEAYEALTDKQRMAANDRLHIAGEFAIFGADYHRVIVQMIEAARKQKCSPAKLTNKKVLEIIGRPDAVLRNLKFLAS